MNTSIGSVEITNRQLELILEALHTLLSEELTKAAKLQHKDIVLPSTLRKAADISQLIHEMLRESEQ